MDRRKGQKRDLPRPLNGQRQHSLVLGAVAGNPPGNDLASFRNEISQCFRVFVIYLEFAIHTKTAHLAPMERSSSAS
jgi:hypothetical protein